jgi:serine protease Do
MDRPPEGSPHEHLPHEHSPDPDQRVDSGQGQPLRGPIDPTSPGWVRVEADVDAGDESDHSADAAAGLPEKTRSPEESASRAALPDTGKTPAADADAVSAARIAESIGDGPHVEQYRAADGGPSRTLMFHRFDPQAARVRRPHLARDADSAWRPDEFAATESSPSRSMAPAESRGEDDDEVTLIDESAVVDEPGPPEELPAIRTRPNHQSERTEPIRHGIVMLVTVMLMLAAARFILPGVIEEIRYAQHRGQLRAEFEVARGGLKDVSLDTLSQAYQMVSAAAGPSVVHIDVRRSDEQAIAHADFPGAPSILISDQGSGVIVDAEGYILTNRHVIAGSDEISVTLSDGRSIGAVVVGTDELTDLAVLKVNADNLIPIPWGNSDTIRVGSPVWAIGSPFGLDRTVTFGILSGKHRVVRAKDRYQDFMQSDAAVNPGNSGGPLVDSGGTLIGINTAIVGDTYQGVSFAIPSTVAKKIYQQLRLKGKIERGWLGVSLAEVPAEKLRDGNHRVRGALIVALADPNSGAARAGLKPGDIVVRVDQETIRDVDHLMQVIGNAMAGTRIELHVLREREDTQEELSFDVLLGRRPPQLSRR